MDRLGGGARWYAVWLALGLTLVGVTPLSGHDLNERLSVSGVASLAGQCQQVRHGDPSADRCRLGLTFQPELSFRSNAAHELFFKLGFGVEDGLNDPATFVIPTWAADLEGAVREINGTGRDFLLTAWYRHTTELEGGGGLGVTAGIIDGTDFLDTNAYSNDELTQFMNSALVNGPNVFVPSYDPGLALQWQSGPLSLAGVYMRVARQDADDYDFFGVEAAYRVEMPFGQGNYRLLFEGSSPDFEDATGSSLERREALLLSCDQQLGDKLGAFVRAGVQNDDSAIEHRSLYSGGIDIGGSAWGRPLDNIGVGFAYVTGGNLGIARSRIGEAYYRFVVTGELAITGDLQYVADDLDAGRGPAGWIFGLRATTRF